MRPTAARVIGSAIAGYLLIFGLVFAAMSLAWFTLGSDGAFRPGVWDVTPLWLALMLGAALVAAAVGGYVTASFTPDRRGPIVLVAIVIVVGIIFALPVLFEASVAATELRPDGLPLFDALQRGRQPGWAALLNPVLGALGVALGVKLRARSP